MIYQINPTGPYQQWADLPALVPTDVIEVLRGYNYNPIGISNLSGVTIGAYGTGAEPIFGSLKTATGWTHLGSNRWSKTDAALGSFLNVLVIDGVPRNKGRYPANPDEFLTISADTVVDETDPENPTDNYLDHGTLPFTASGEVVIRLQGFITNTYPVVSDTGGRITYPDQGGQYPPKAGYGFALQNQIECLTQDGDWMYNASTKTITIYYSGTPNDHVIQYPTNEQALTITGSDNLIFSGVHFVGANGDTANVSTTHDIAFLTCKAKYAGGMGIRLADGNCDDFTFTDFRVDHAFAEGMYAFFGCDRIHATGCQAFDIGMVEGGSAYMNYDGRSNGFCFEGGTNNLLQNCHAERIGFNGFVYGGNGTQVIDCTAVEFCAKKADGGGFYTYNPEGVITTRITFRGNIARNGIGRIAGTLDSIPNAQGFYFDNGSNGIDVSDCLAENNPVGTYMHDVWNCTFSGLVNYGNVTQLKMNNNPGMNFSGNTVTGMWNIVTAINQQMVSSYGTAEQIADFGTFSGNRYSNFKTGRPIFSTWDGSEPKPHKYEINPSVWFAMLGETDVTLEDYEEIPYEIVSELESIDYRTTTPAWNEFGAISGGGISASQDATGITFTKVGAPKNSGFLRMGPVEAGKWYLVAGQSAGDRNNLQTDFESNYTAPGNPVKNCKINSDTFALPIYSAIDRAVEQFYLLMEKEFTSAKFVEIALSEITVSRTTSLAAIQVDEENHTWEIALDGVFPEIPEVTFPDGSFTYDGTVKSLAIVGTLPEGAAVEYSNNGRTNAGTQVVTATITGDFETIILTADLTITPAAIEGVTFEDAVFTFDETEKTVLITGEIPAGCAVEYLNNTRTEAGTQEATATITGSNYTTLILTAELTVNAVGEDEVLVFKTRFHRTATFNTKFTRTTTFKTKFR